MRTAVIAGASGLVGSRCLHHLLAHDDVGRVVALVRRPLAVSHPKLVVRTVDWTTLTDEAIPKDVDDAYCALGTTMKQAGSKEAFLAVDKRAILAFAESCRARGARRFILVSSLGADARSMNLYLRTKGEVDDRVRALGFDVVHVLRPSILDGERAESRPGERAGLVVMRAAAKVLGPRFRYAPISVDTVGRAMVQLAFADTRGNHVHDSPALQTFAS